ncbi:MAG: arsenic efflux protein [Bacilli bacterium]|nr:arsenic efflux protein [Bacilli bacterium]
MPWDVIKDILLDSLKDSGLVFIFVFLVHLLLSFIDHQFANFLVKRKKTSPLFGALFGLIPQCGTSVLGADLYIKKYISIGTLTAIFLSCSDEAFISILTSGKGDKIIMILPLMGLKFLIGFIIGYLFDLINRKQNIIQVDEVEEEHECHTHHHENTKVHRHLVHPLIHSLEIFIYVLIINIGFSVLIYYIGEDNFKNFIITNRYLTPLYSSIIGLIPNCASSLFLSELFIDGSLSFGALLSGLLVNAGLGMMILLKSKHKGKDILFIFLVCFITAIISGYITCLISGF